MELIIVTGLSGAGKSKAVDILEDIGFFCVDNMPPKLVPAFAQLLLKSTEQAEKAAIVIDIRAGNNFNDLFASLDAIKEMGGNFKILFIDASNDTLINRYKETRRKHPLSNKNKGSIDSAINAEREVLRPIRQMADYIIDTSHLKPTQFKERVASLFLENIKSIMPIQCMSFGFKYGIPADADLVFDVRCLPNPFYIDELKKLTGLDEPVRNYVMKWEQAKGLVPKLLDLIVYLVALYREEGKSQLVVAIGCTGGRHRSVAFAELVYKHLLEEKGMNVSVTHRDIAK
ncbi:MAG: RNase adapter RapZ [Oscillospiraceae bacterium]